MYEYTREEVIEKIRKGESLKGADLSGIDLSKVDFRSKEDGGICVKPANFEGANFENANLFNIKLRSANLKHTIFTNANLNRADLIHADLSGAFLLSAEIAKAGLIKTDLSGADLRFAKLNGSVLDGAKLINSKLNNANIRCAELHGAKLNKANLSNANLNDAILTGKADITGANIYRIICYGWKLDGIKCEYIYLCPDDSLWDDQDKREKDIKKFISKFDPGKFETLYNGFTLPFSDVQSILMSMNVRKRWDNDLKRQEKLKVKEDIRQELVKGCSCDHIQLAEYMYFNLSVEYFEEKIDFQKIIKEVLSEVYKDESYKRIRNSKGFHKLPPCPIHQFPFC